MFEAERFPGKMTGVWPVSHVNPQPLEAPQSFEEVGYFVEHFIEGQIWGFENMPDVQGFEVRQ